MVNPENRLIAAIDAKKPQRNCVHDMERRKSGSSNPN